MIRSNTGNGGLSLGRNSNCERSRCASLFWRFSGFRRRSDCWNAELELKVEIPAHRTALGKKPVCVIVRGDNVRQRGFDQF